MKTQRSEHNANLSLVPMQPQNIFHKDEASGFDTAGYERYARARLDERSAGQRRALFWHRVRSAILFAIFLGCVAVAGKLGMNDTLRERDNYCQMVKAHLWPDFRHIVKTECKIEKR